MPPPDAILEPTINVGPFGKAAWRQAGRIFGHSESGYFEQITFEGTINEVLSLASSYNAAGALWEVTTLTARRARLTVRLGTTPGGAEIPEDVWELDAQETQKDLLEADFPFSDLDAIDKFQRQVIRLALENNVGLEAARGRVAEDNPGETVEITPAVTSLYLLMKAGTRYFPVEASVIRHNRTVSNVWAAQASFLNVGRILSNTAMNSLEGSGNLFLFSLPTLPSAKQYIETKPTPTTLGDLQYGWHKNRPRIVRLTYNKWQISNTYQFGLWAVKLYGAVL